jgi:Protein of unknown function (DUF1566)
MKRTQGFRLVVLLGLIVSGMVVFAAGPAGAATAAGPYYASPSWDQTLPAATRFIVLTNMASQAVLDRETGLVWEQSPSTSTVDWFSAHDFCNALSTGGRQGWRLPTLQELGSLVDPGQFSPSLPPGHPFSNVQSAGYWSASSWHHDPSYALAAGFFDGGSSAAPKSTSDHFWCVRGGQGVDPQ